jgi:dipeptide/tripeptide permease
MNIEVNYTAVLIAAVVSMIAGAVWYALFNKLLQKIRPLSDEEQLEFKKQMKVTFGVGFLLTLVMSEVLFHFVAMTEMLAHLGLVQSALATVFFIYVGFVMPVQANHIIYGNYGKLSKKMKLFAINTGGQLVSLIAMGITIGLMG